MLNAGEVPLTSKVLTVRFRCGYARARAAASDIGSKRPKVRVPRTILEHEKRMHIEQSMLKMNNF
jgi:hypothetical protein